MPEADHLLMLLREYNCPRTCPRSPKQPEYARAAWSNPFGIRGTHEYKETKHLVSRMPTPRGKQSRGISTNAAHARRPHHKRLMMRSRANFVHRGCSRKTRR